MKNSQFVDDCEKNGADGMTSRDNLTLSLIARTNCRLVKPSFAETIREARIQMAYRSADDMEQALTALKKAWVLIFQLEISDAIATPMNGIFDEINSAKERIQKAITANSLEIEAMELANEEAAS